MVIMMSLFNHASAQYKFMLCLIANRILAKSGDGKLIVSHTQGEPFFFTFGKSEVSIEFMRLHGFYLGILYLLIFLSSHISSVQI